MEPIREFINELMVRAGLDRALLEGPLAEQREALEMQLRERLGVVFLSALSDQAAKEYANLFSGKKEPAEMEVQNFFRAKLPNYEQVAQNALTEFANEFLEAVARK